MLYPDGRYVPGQQYKTSENIFRHTHAIDSYGVPHHRPHQIQISTPFIGMISEQLIATALPEKEYSSVEYR